MSVIWILFFVYFHPYFEIALLVFVSHCGKKEKKLRNSNQMNMLFISYIVTLILESGKKFRLNLWSMWNQHHQFHSNAKQQKCRWHILLHICYCFYFRVFVVWIDWCLHSTINPLEFSFCYDFDGTFSGFSFFLYFCYGTGTSVSIINWKSTNVTDNVSTN